MKIAIAGGHSKAAPGTSGYLDEYECDRAYVAQLIPALRAAGFDVVDCTNEASTSNAELAEEVRIANGSGADVFLAVHFNSGIGKDTDETTGTECFYTDGNEEGRRLASALSANVAGALRVKDRGAKTAKFYVLRNTRMTALLLEVCFVDDKDDAARWGVTSWDALTSAVVRAFGGSVAQAPPRQSPRSPRRRSPRHRARRMAASAVLTGAGSTVSGSAPSLAWATSTSSGVATAASPATTRARPSTSTTSTTSPTATSGAPTSGIPATGATSRLAGPPESRSPDDFLVKI